MRRMETAARFLKELWQALQADHVFNGAAAVAFFLMLSIFPAAIFLISLIPYLPIPNLHRAIPVSYTHMTLPTTHPLYNPAAAVH